MSRQFVFGAGVLAIVLSAAALHAGQAPAPALSKQDSESLQRKLAAIEARGNQPTTNTAKPLRTSFTEREVNAYFKYDGKTHLPTGVADPQITIADNGQVEAKAIVDMDAVRKAQSNMLLDLISVFTGSVEVKAAGRLQAADGKGTLAIDKASVGGFPVPKSVLQSVISHYSKSPDLPDGFNLDKPFDLPASIRSVQTQRGTAIIIQ
jgi:hypothetical protein